jgi:hypothetical protein
VHLIVALEQPRGHGAHVMLQPYFSMKIGSCTNGGYLDDFDTAPAVTTIRPLLKAIAKAPINVIDTFMLLSRSIEEGISHL